MKYVFLMGAALLVCAPAQGADFGYHQVFDRWAKVNTFFDAASAVTDWLQCFRPSVGQAVAGDEFAAADVHKSSLTLMKREIADTDTAAPLTIRTNAEFGQYDFAAHHFAFRPIADGTFFQTNSGTANCGPRAFPATLRVIIGNPGFIDGLPMADEQAKAFIASRRLSSAFVDRSVQMILHVRADQLAGDDALTGTIVGYELVDTGPQKLGIIAHSP